MAKLAVVGEILELIAIEGADRIVQAVVDCGDAGRWRGTVPKDVHRIGERVTVFLQDALLPESERWAFMAARGWRVRMARFRGVPSECLIVAGAPDLPPGSDLAEALSVKKYEKPIPASMAGDAVAAFPSFLPKTDEPNYQTVPDLVADFLANPEHWVCTEKADGTSCTVWNDATGLHVCSRNWELSEFSASGAGNAYWRAARQYGLERLPQGVGLQFEVVGPGIQGNPMGLSGLEARAFALRDIATGKACSFARLQAVCESLQIPLARRLEIGAPSSMDQLQLTVDSLKYGGGRPMEGIVLARADGSASFKVISFKYSG